MGAVRRGEEGVGPRPEADWCPDLAVLLRHVPGNTSGLEVESLLPSPIYTSGEFPDWPPHLAGWAWSLGPGLIVAPPPMPRAQLGPSRPLPQRRRRPGTGRLPPPIPDGAALVLGWHGGPHRIFCSLLEYSRVLPWARDIMGGPSNPTLWKPEAGGSSTVLLGPHNL